MRSFADLIQQGSAYAWLFIPSAILLGALHGLEPGHSKTMMAAFIVAIRGTVGQAVLLGLAATVSHTLVIWVIAIGGMYLWRGVNAEVFEPYFQLASAVVIIGMAVWMLWRTRQDQQRARTAAGDDHRHADHHHHGAERRPVDTGHGGHNHDGDRSNGEGRRHDHRHHLRGRDAAMDGDQTAHERQHADDIRRSFADRKVTTWQIVVFGLTGGLIPCPAAITVLALCLQLEEITLGFALVLCFSIGLAITLIAVGATAALSVGHAMQRWSWLGAFARRAPYFSGVLIIAVGLYVGYHGWAALAATALAPVGG